MCLFQPLKRNAPDRGAGLFFFDVVYAKNLNLIPKCRWHSNLEEELKEAIPSPDRDALDHVVFSMLCMLKNLNLTPKCRGHSNLEEEPKEKIPPPDRDALDHVFSMLCLLKI